MGSVVLEESPDEAGMLLWQSLRNVMLWAVASPEERGALFLPGASRRRLADLRASDLDPALKRPLRVIARMLGDSAPTTPEAPAAACRDVSAWAE